MTKSLRVMGVVFVCLAIGVCATRAQEPAARDSLILRGPQGVRVYAQMNPDRTTFLNYIFWEDVPKDSITLVHAADTVGWQPASSAKPDDINLSFPQTGGVYTGNIDRTIKFRVLNSGEVGVGGYPPNSSIMLRYEVVGSEYLNGTIDIGAGYTPAEPAECVLDNTRENTTLDIGFTVAFSDPENPDNGGWVDSNGVFIIGLEDFEGYHVFRALNEDGRDATAILEISKEEANDGAGFDSLYYSEILPALRHDGVYELDSPVMGLGDEINIRGVHPNGKLGENELFWVDRNAFNGFTYYFLVSTFDRGYNVRQTSQGLLKCGHCCWNQGEDQQNVACPCEQCDPQEIVPVSTELKPQGDLPQVFAVPNPYRSGSSQYTTENYHNYPDNKLRFFNTPSVCELKVYTVAGDLVWETSQTNGTGTIAWDTKNLQGEEVSSGVYLFRLESQTGNWVYGRIIIIR